MPQPLAIYIHWPFCKFKCPYCDFNSHVRDQINQSDWKDSYLKELQFYFDKTGKREISSIFFGGGTPSLMNAETAEILIQEIDNKWGLSQNCEITLEANPTSVETEKLHDFKSTGINRVSLGIQSLRDNDLKKLGRQHSTKDALKALETASNIFDRYSFDLIYARENQTLKAWEEELKEALNYAGGHMSLYQLTIEEGTGFYTLYKKGKLKTPEEQITADMYEATQDIMNAANLPAYEISNHAKKGEESRHNMAYWQYKDYIGIGPGAHGRLTLDGQKYATQTHKLPETWVEQVKEKNNGALPFEKIDNNTRAQEFLMMGLRLKTGISLDAFEKETQTSFSDFTNQENLQYLIDEKFLKQTTDRIYATAEGLQRLNAILPYLIADKE